MILEVLNPFLIPTVLSVSSHGFRNLHFPVLGPETQTVVVTPCPSQYVTEVHRRIRIHR